MRKKFLSALFAMLMVFLLMTGCGSSDTLKDGYYTAETKEFSHGWKEYVCIQVKNDVIISVEFNAKNESGFIKAWDNNYMRNMNSVQGTYPTEYTREYAQQLLAQQKDIEVDMVTGASSSGANFEKLVNAVLEQARKGDPSVAVVE